VVTTALFLLEDFDLLQSLVLVLSTSLKIPVTCKIRILPDPQQTLVLCRKLQDSGCSILTVHGRTKEQKKQFVGPNDFQMIELIKKSLVIPVFSNGGIENLADVHRCLQITKVDGVMVSEAILGDPSFFSGCGGDSVELAAEYLQYAQRYGATTAVRAHLFKILYRQLTLHLEVRTLLSEGTITDLFNVIQLIRTKQQEVKSQGDGQQSDLYKDIPIWYNRHNSRALNGMHDPVVNNIDISSQALPSLDQITDDKVHVNQDMDYLSPGLLAFLDGTMESGMEGSSTDGQSLDSPNEAHSSDGRLAKMSKREKKKLKREKKQNKKT